MARGQVLYEATKGTLPEEQGWGYGALPGTARLTFSGDAARLDTTALAAEHAGFSLITPWPLERTNGFTVHFTLRLEAETHLSTNRAGLSVIVLAADKRGLELGFWTNRIWAQSDQPLFTHAEEAVFDPTLAFVDYALSVVGDRYVLTADGVELLTGPVRDYTAFAGPIDPYETPDFLFFGDDTGSALGEFSLRRVELTASRATALTFEAPGDGTLALVWPAGSASLLQATDILGAGANWEFVANAVATDHGTNRVVLAITANRRFFRLGP